MSAAKRVSIVTGAGSGIGRASARALARRGSAVVVSDINEEGGAETVAMIEEGGGSASFQRCDVSVEADVAGLVERAISEYGRLDYAHNNAGIGGPPGTLADYEVETWNRILASPEWVSSAVTGALLVIAAIAAAPGVGEHFATARARWRTGGTRSDPASNVPAAPGATR